MDLLENSPKLSSQILEGRGDKKSSPLYTNRDENIRYICRYISDISDIGDVRHDVGDDQYIADISVLDRYIVEISGL